MTIVHEELYIYAKNKLGALDAPIHGAAAVRKINFL